MLHSANNSTIHIKTPKLQFSDFGTVAEFEFYNKGLLEKNLKKSWNHDKWLISPTHAQLFALSIGFITNDIFANFEYLKPE